MSKDLQIIKQLEARFGIFKYDLNDKGDVVELLLLNKGVEAKDLKLIGELTSLEVLNLYVYKIIKIQDLDKLTKLERLWLGHNNITTIQGLSKLINLQYLSLSHNKIDKIQGLSKLINLQNLLLNNNEIIPRYHL